MAAIAVSASEVNDADLLDMMCAFLMAPEEGWNLPTGSTSRCRLAPACALLAADLSACREIGEPVLAVQPSWGDCPVDPMTLRPRLSPGLPFSESSSAFDIALLHRLQTAAKCIDDGRAFRIADSD
jgi:hypothetical protein